MPVAGAECQLITLGALEVKVGRILPGYADDAVQLHALLGGVHRDPSAVGLRHGRGDVGVRIVVHAGIDGIARRGVRRPGLEPQIGQPMLDRLIGADRTTELLALLGIG